MTWTWWMTLLAIFAALVLIGCIPVGVDARYNAEGVFLAAKLGPIRLQLLPQKPKKKKKQQKKPFLKTLLNRLLKRTWQRDIVKR